MDLPRKHHYKPVFFLSRWTGKDGRLCEMRLINGKVVQKRKYPQNTGCIKDLYRTDGVPEEISQNLETKFMAPLDTKAARALSKIISAAPLDIDERAAWARFLLSMLYRNRECVEFIKAHMTELWREATAALEQDWAARRKPDEQRSLAEAMVGRQLGAAETSAANILSDIIGNHRAVPDIVRMNWGKLNLSGSKIPLLTSDRPLALVALSDPNAYIALPVGPHDLFVAAFDDRFSRPHLDATEVAWRMNKDVVSNGREFVWGVDDSQIDFVRTYIGSAPDRVILSREQQEESLAAARGLAAAT